MGRKSKNSTKLNKKQREKKRRGNRKYDDTHWKAEKFKLKLQLSRFGLDIKEIAGDGNCLFRAISDQISGTEEMHLEIRALAVEFMRRNPNDFQPFIEDDEDFAKYLKRMSESGTWGGNLELQALSIALEVNIKIHRLNEPVWEILNFTQKRSINLSYHDGDHYNSVRVKGDLTNEIPKLVPENLVVIESKEEFIMNGFQECAEYVKEAYGFEDIGKTIKVLKRMYGEPPDIELVLENIGKIMDEVYREEEEEKIEKREKEKGKEKHLVQGKKPIVLPNNKQKCWCGSGKIYKKCCKATDYLRETEEEKIITDMKSLQI